MNKIVYVVFGGCGEYDDRTDWPVKAFLETSKAVQLQNKLNQWCKDNNCDKGRGDITYLQHPPEDKSFQSDYTGTEYYIMEIELET